MGIHARSISLSWDIVKCAPCGSLTSSVSPIPSIRSMSPLTVSISPRGLGLYGEHHGRYMPRAARSNCAGSLGRKRRRRSPAGCPQGDEARNSIRIPPSEPQQAQIDRYRKYRQPPVDSYRTTNLIGVWKFADLLGAMGSMACRETTACRDKWGEQWNSNRVHRAEHVG